MRKLFLLCLILVAAVFVLPCLRAEEIEAKSKITQVAVYPDSALVTRSAALDLAAGEHRVIFADIIPDIDENSLRVSGSGTAQVKILGAQLKKEYLTEKPGERIRQLEKQIEDFEVGKRESGDQHNILMQEREFLNSLRFHVQEQLPKDLVTKAPAVKEVADLLAFLDTELKTNFSGSLEIELKIKDTDKKLEALKKELSGISTTAKLKRFISVDMQVLGSGSLDLNLSYSVSGVSWRPVYDARASFEKGRTEFVTYGVVSQKTGEDWLDVDVSLLTSKPALGGRMPDVDPWFLRFYQPALRGKSYGRGVSRQNAPMVTALQESLNDKTAATKQEVEMGWTESEERGTGVAYKLPRKTTVKSDGSDYKLPVGSQTLISEFNYAAYPRQSVYAYLRAAVVNSDVLQLPAGQVNIFLEGDYVGHSDIRNVGPGEKFDVYLGVDENVKVKREQVEKKIDDILVGNIPAATIKVTLSYKIILENYKNKDITLHLFEAMPVSEDERIKAKVVYAKPEPTEKDWESRKGVWRWEFKLKPKDKKEVFYTLSIEYPRNTQVEDI